MGENSLNWYELTSTLDYDMMHDSEAKASRRLLRDAIFIEEANSYEADCWLDAAF